MIKESQIKLKKEFNNSLNKIQNKNRRFNRQNMQSLKEEWKNQFIVKQSFKWLYGKNNFLSLNESKKINNNNQLKFSKNVKLQEKQFKKISNFDSIETRRDVLICRLNWANTLHEARNLLKNNQINIYYNNKKINNHNTIIYLKKGLMLEYINSTNNHNNSSWNLSYVLQFNENNSSYAVIIKNPTFKEHQEILNYWLKTAINETSNNKLSKNATKRLEKINHLITKYDKLKLF